MSEKEIDESQLAPETTSPAEPGDGPNKEKSEKTEDQIRIEELEVDKEGLIDQVKDQREKRQDAEVKLEEALKPKPGEGGEAPSDAETVVRKVLSEERQRESKLNREAALEKFLEKNKFYHKDNDPTGLRREKLESTLKRLNVSDSHSVANHIRDLEDAAKLISVETGGTPPVDLGGAASESKASAGGQPKSEDEQKLTATQEALRKEKGWTVEYYLEMKEKYPSVVT